MMKYKESQEDKKRWDDLKRKESEKILYECKEVEKNLDKALLLSKQRDADAKKYSLLSRYV